MPYILMAMNKPNQTSPNLYWAGYSYTKGNHVWSTNQIDAVKFHTPIDALKSGVHGPYYSSGPTDSDITWRGVQAVPVP